MLGGRHSASGAGIPVRRRGASSGSFLYGSSRPRAWGLFGAAYACCVHAARCLINRKRELTQTLATGCVFTRTGCWSLVESRPLAAGAGELGGPSSSHVSRVPWIAAASGACAARRCRPWWRRGRPASRGPARSSTRRPSLTRARTPLERLSERRRGLTVFKSERRRGLKV